MLEYSDVIFRVDGDGRFEQLTSMDELRAEDLSSAEEGSPRA
jgi:hypothetical protein